VAGHVLGMLRSADAVQRLSFVHLFRDEGRHLVSS
jgi:hypothetical protein